MTITLDEAILHAQEKAQTHCGACAQEHQQLAEWLSELKQLREQLKSIADVVLEEPLSRETLESLAENTKVRFQPKNKVVFGQDMHICQGADTAIIYKVEGHLEDTGVWLSGPGCGGDPYGNGRLMVYYNQDYLKRFEKK